MHVLALILAAIAATGPEPVATLQRSAGQPGETAAGRAGNPEERVRPPGAAGGTPENLLAGPARCVLRYLDAVRLAGPRAAGRLPPAPREKDYARVKALTAPRTLDEIARRAAAGEDHPLAPWREAARAGVLESFQLVAVRRASRGAAIVTVAEDFWRPPGVGLARAVSEYLVARVDGEWKVVDRSAGQAFDDVTLGERYEGFFDDPAAAR